jgi:lysyl-tRNA synthetase class 2
MHKSDIDTTSKKCTKVSFSYKDNRLKDLAEVEKLGISIYPHVFDSGGLPVTSTRECRSKYDYLVHGEHTDVTVAMMGRIYSIRSASKNLVFFDLFDEGHKIQVMANLKVYRGSERELENRTPEEHVSRNTVLFRTITKLIHDGDNVGVYGTLCKTKLGELSILPSYIQILSPCLHQVPRGGRVHEGNVGLTNSETRYRKRYLDLMVNDEVSRIFITRSRVIQFIRRYLTDLGFLEVDTPVLDVMAGGAIAKPFVTKSHALNTDMYMRIAPELYLKMLVIGGMNKVFEIGRQFRNESADHTHNPEFTSCEFYMRGADYKDIMEINEDMYRKLVKDVTGDYLVKHTVHNESCSEDIFINFAEKFGRIDMIPTLEDMLGEKFPDPSTFASDEARIYFDALCVKHSVDCTAPRTVARLLDKLVGYFIEPLCINPTFVYGHPQIMSPLAKWDRDRPGLTERFELFINSMEYSNAYTEMNDPAKQLTCFESQGADRDAGDDEAQQVDSRFIEALEHGLPPTGGWGCGIDRLCMLISNVDTIREVILFPAMKGC